MKWRIIILIPLAVLLAVAVWCLSEAVSDVMESGGVTVNHSVIVTVGGRVWAK